MRTNIINILKIKMLIFFRYASSYFKIENGELLVSLDGDVSVSIHEYLETVYPKIDKKKYLLLLQDDQWSLDDDNIERSIDLSSFNNIIIGTNYHNLALKMDACEKCDSDNASIL